jgi:hypothetical protein
VTRLPLVLLLLHAALQPSSLADGPPSAARARPTFAERQAPGSASTDKPQTPVNGSPSGATAANQTPGNATPGNATPAGPPPIDPATTMFASNAGMIVVTVKPDKTADYEAVIVALQDALSKAVDEPTRLLASGWRVFKASDLDAKSNAIYIHLLDPAIAETDYRPSQWLDRLLDGAPLELLSKYRDAFGAPPTKLSLVEFAKMSVAPVPKPGNASPDAPSPPAKPGNTSPQAPAKNGSPGEPWQPGQLRGSE